jgi:hypothetical protein
MAKKLGKKARKFARKNLQSTAKRNRKIRNQFNHRRPRRGEPPPSFRPTNFFASACSLACVRGIYLRAFWGRFSRWQRRPGGWRRGCASTGRRCLHHVIQSSSFSFTLCNWLVQMLYVTWLVQMLCCNSAHSSASSFA